MRAPVYVVAFIAALACVVPVAACAQSAPSEIEVRVADAAGKPLADARVYVNGAQSTSALTPRDGVIRFSGVDPGIYRLRVVLSGFATADVDDVEALAGRRTLVDVTLERPVPKSTAAATPPPAGSLKEIGRVRARPAVIVSSVDVDEGNPLRRISENLADALDKIAGISVSQPPSGNTLTISLRNGDPSQTIGRAGGAALVGAGQGTLQAVAADLSTGVSADGGSSIAAVGGSVNFRTLEPTKTWQAQTSVSYGTYERTNAQISLSGSYHKLGIAAQHAVRGGDSILTGLRFADTSGETYVHDGAFDRLGDFLKLRYPVGRVTLSGAYLAGSTRSSALCDQFVTALPCGYGPGGETKNYARLANLSAQGQIGNVTVTAQIQRNAFHSVDDELGRIIAGTPSPFGSDIRQTVTGWSDYSTIAIHRHTLLLNVGAYTGHGTVVSVGRFQGTSPTAYKLAYYVVGDTLKFSDRWNATLAYGLNSNLARTTSAADLAVVLTPSRSETLAFSTGMYGGGTFSTIGGFFGDPSGAQYNCPADEVRVDGPADAPLAGSTRTINLSYDRRGRRGSLHLGAYDRLDRNSSILAQFPIVALPPGAVPAGYLDQVAAFWHAAPICGTRPFDAARVFVAEQIAGPTVRYRGVEASGQVVLGRSVIALPSYAVSGAQLVSSDPRLLYRGSPYAVGAQLPFRPLHKAGFLIDAVQPRAHLEWVANGTWTSGNNAAGLGSYVIVSAGLSWTAQRGRLSLFANNLFNTDTGLFATQEFAQPLPLRGGGSYVPIPTLAAPRTYTLLYSVRAGRTK